MEALILLEPGDKLILHTKDMQKIEATFHEHDFENKAMIVDLLSELQAFGYDEIDYVKFQEPITGASMINNRLALSQQAVDKWRGSHRIKSDAGDYFLVDIGILTSSTYFPSGGAAK